MALFHESRTNLKIPRGKYSGWLVNQVPVDYLFWVNTAGMNTPLYEWLHTKGRPKEAPQPKPRRSKRARAPSRQTQRWVDHIGHESIVRANRKGRGIVHCVVCKKDIHVMTEQELLKYLAATNPEI